MKSRFQSYMRLVRIVGIFALVFGIYSPTLAVDYPDLSVTSTHDAFSQGEINKTYTIVVSNTGIIPTDGTQITLTDTIPAGLIPQSISIPTGWTCPTGDISALTVITCTRTTPLASQETSTFILTVDVTVDAGSAPTHGEDPNIYNAVTNTLNVVGGGDQDASNIYDDYTLILLRPDLYITGYEIRDSTKTTVITHPQPNEAFWIRMTVKNRGGLATGNFYPGVFIDNHANYEKDHDEPSASPVPLNLGDITSFSDYRITPPGGVNNTGCLYYDPNGLITPDTQIVNTEKGNYTRPDLLPSLPAGGETFADVYIAYPLEGPYSYTSSIYDDLNIRTGLSTGTYSLHLYIDPSCLVDNESYEDNNVYPGVGQPPINLVIGSGGGPYPPTLLVNSVLPTSRTPVVGNPVTIFNTVINAGSEIASDVTLSMTNKPAGTFTYNETNCATNAIISGANPLSEIAPGGVACYILTFTPSAPFAATYVHISAQAANAPSTNLLTGINTWLLRSTSIAGPDTIALTTTTDFHQVACSGTGAFAVASSNVGAATTGDITVTANTGGVSLPLGLTIVETNPATGVIIGDNVLQNVGAGDNRTVVVFVTFQGCVSFDPAGHRIFIEFRDASNNIIGSTSTAVSTNR